MSATYATPPLIPPNTNAQSGYVDLLEVGTLIVENMSTEGVIVGASIAAIGNPTAGTPIYSVITASGSLVNAVVNQAVITASGGVGYPATIQATGAGAVIVSPTFTYSGKVTSYTGTTTVPITSAAGTVTVTGLTTASGAVSTFTLTGTTTLIPATAQVMLQLASYAGTAVTTIPTLSVITTAAGTITVSVTNNGSAPLNGTLAFNYMIV